MQQDNNYIKMTAWPIPKLVVSLSIPTIISMLVTNIYNMADTYFVSELGNSASGAVGVVLGLMSIIQAFGFMFGHGAGSIIARKLGEQDEKSASVFASLSIFSCLLVGVLIGVFGLIFINPFMKILGSTSTILPYAIDYSKYILISAPFTMASFALNNILRYEGKAFFGMIGLTIGGIINMICDPILIFGLNMGIAGAGLSTAVSQVIGFFILIYMFLSGKTKSKLSFSALIVAPKNIYNIMATGFPSLSRQGLNSIATMILNNLARGFGDEMVAAISIVNKITFFIFAITLGVGQGFQPVASFNYGAKKYSRVRKAFSFTLISGEVFLAAASVIVMIFSGDLVGFFRDDLRVIEIGTIVLRFQLIALVFQPLTVCANMLYQCIGANKLATFLSMLRNGIVFVPMVLLLTYFFGELGLESAQGLSDVIAFFITLPITISFFKKLPKE